MNRKAQLNLLVIVFVLLFLAGIAVFLISAVQGISQDEYLNLYTNQLLLSVLREDTGFTDPACRTNADLAACAFLTPSHPCDRLAANTCSTLAETRVNAGFAAYDPLRPNLRWLLTVEPQGFVTFSGSQQLHWELGDATVKDSRQHYAANTRIQKQTASGPALLKVQLLISTR